MTIKIAYHIMPWEIDYALLTFMQLKKSKYYLPKDTTIIIDSVLNLSDALIDWKSSKLPKEYFVDKYDTISLLLCDYIHNKKVYAGDELYGHLNLQRDCISSEVDFYMGICPDMYFSEHLLSYMVQTVQQIPNEYFVLTPQICRMWDPSWDVLVNPQFAVGSYYGWEKTTDIFDVDYYLHTSKHEMSVTQMDSLKWAGWFDMYSKSFYEKLARIPDDWNGYGGWDWYSMNVAGQSIQKGYDFVQYLLNGQIVFEYGVGPLRTDTINGFCDYYKKFLVRQDTSVQRDSFNEKVNSYIKTRVDLL